LEPGAWAPLARLVDVYVRAGRFYDILGVVERWKQIAPGDAGWVNGRRLH
jgi:hypothetical protein